MEGFATSRHVGPACFDDPLRSCLVALRTEVENAMQREPDRCWPNAVFSRCLGRISTSAKAWLAACGQRFDQIQDELSASRHTRKQLGFVTLASRRYMTVRSEKLKEVRIFAAALVR